MSAIRIYQKPKSDVKIEYQIRKSLCQRMDVVHETRNNRRDGEEKNDLKKIWDH